MKKQQEQDHPSFRWRWRLTQGVAAGLLALPLGALAQQAFTRAGVSLMAGPGNSYPVVAMLGEGQPVDVMGCTRGYGWCDVVLPDGLRGWLYAAVLEYPYQGTPVPLPGYAAVIGVPIITFTIGSYWGRYYRDRPWYPEPRWWGGRTPPPPTPGWRPPPPSRPSWQPHAGPPPANFRPPKPPAWQQPRPEHGVRPPRDPGIQPPRPGISTPRRPANVGDGGRQWDNNHGGRDRGDRGNHGGPPPSRSSIGGPQHDRGSNAGPPPNRGGGGGGGGHGQGRGGGGGGGHGNHGGGGDKGKDR